LLSSLRQVLLNRLDIDSIDTMHTDLTKGHLEVGPGFEYARAKCPHEGLLRYIYLYVLEAVERLPMIRFDSYGAALVFS
jgi:hypothetical protein